jgi:uncharacterized lipoprotein NlpE involved in copper resistance
MKKVISLILVITIMLLVGCEEVSQADTQYKYIQDRNSRCCIYVDEKTGVNYIKYIDVYGGGITPRLNADGTPYVSEVNGNE